MECYNCQPRWLLKQKKKTRQTEYDCPHSTRTTDGHAAHAQTEKLRFSETMGIVNKYRIVCAHKFTHTQKTSNKDRRTNSTTPRMTLICTWRSFGFSPSQLRSPLQRPDVIFNSCCQSIGYMSVGIAQVSRYHRLRRPDVTLNSCCLCIGDVCVYPSSAAGTITACHFE